ncbi:MAG: 1-acyl-sn-glycerol-3-phosphate acyltransferase [Candidatus Omnitrophota bacterium]|nr:MAG: 1-acyl-sn-glycerol-3-phosphate acyltransferase [Candidatus Omnitrophota bacterium]
MTYLISRFILKALLKILFRFESRGSENLPQKGPFIVASNHASLIDPAVVGVACGTMPLIFMAKRELFSVPILGRWVRAVGCIPVERDSGSFKPLKNAVQKLKEGKALGIFPEGRRSPDGRLQKAEAGIGLLASKSAAPIVPVYVSGTAKALARGKKFITLCKITASIGEIVDVRESAAFSEKKEIYESIGKKVMEAISHLKNE